MNRTTLREVAIPLVSLALLIVIGYLAYDRIVDNRVTPIGEQQNLVSPTGAISVNPDLGSSILPADLPAPEGAAITQSFDLVTKDGDIQGTRSYESPRSIAEEKAAYEAYLSSGGWMVKDSTEAQGYAAILAERDGKQLLASFSTRSGKTHVTINAVAQPATN